MPFLAFFGWNTMRVRNDAQGLALTTNGVAIIRAESEGVEGLTWTNVDPEIKVSEIEKWKLEKI